MLMLTTNTIAHELIYTANVNANANIYRKYSEYLNTCK